MDTAVWSLAFRRRAGVLNATERAFTNELSILIEDELVRLIGPVRQEVLSGIRDSAQFERLKEMLRAFPDEELTTADFETAAQFANACRSKGIAGTPVDFLICATAARRDWEILARDNDFHEYKRVLPLKFRSVRRVDL